MPTTLIVDTNTYATLEELDDFFALRPLGAEWDLITVDANKEKYIVDAYDNLKKFNYTTEPLNATTVEVDGEDVEIDVAASWMVEAQALEALTRYILLSDDDYVRRLSLQLQGIKEISQDKLNEIYEKKHRKIYTLYSRQAFEAIRPYILRFPTTFVQSI
jgi:hypothetical protein